MVERILPLSVSNAVVTKRGKTIVGPIDITIEDIGLTVIMGPNGSGKTTLLKLLHGLEAPKSGESRWNCTIETARLYQSYVFQTPILLRRSVLENVIYPLRLRGISRTQAEQQALHWLQTINLEASANLNARLLSGGEKQKLAVARALAIKPQLVFLDEPTANLDGAATREIEALLKQVKQAGTRVIMTTHDKGQAKRLADDIVFLYRGKIHEHQNAGAFFENASTPEAVAFLSGEIVE